MMRSALPMMLLVAACAPHPAPASAGAAAVAGGENRAGAGCDSPAVQQFVGQAADAAASEALRLSGARTLRRYTTGDMLTMDHRPDRLNVETDATGRVVRLSCG